jgi:succinate dehydrogenase hydrophobic anchor subunit
VSFIDTLLSSFLSRFELVEARATAVALFLFVVLFFYSAYRFAETTPAEDVGSGRAASTLSHRCWVHWRRMFLVAVIAMVHFLETDRVQGLIDLVVKYLAMTTQ